MFNHSKINSMDFYSIDTKLSFGKYKDKTIREILELNPSYINWCIGNIKSFYIEPDIIKQMTTLNSQFSVSIFEEKLLFDKREEFSFARYETHLDFVYKNEEISFIPNDMYSYFFDFDSYSSRKAILGECTAKVQDFLNSQTEKSNYEELSKHGYFDNNGDFISNEESYYNQIDNEVDGSRGYNDNLDPDQQSIDYWNQF